MRGRDPEPETEDCIKTVVTNCGNHFLSSHSVTDLGMHRCLLAAKILRNLDSMRSVDTILYVDDDQVFTTRDAAIVAEAARLLQRPVSGAYVMRQGAARCLAASGVSENPIQFSAPWLERTMWLRQVYTGMGFFAEPRAHFEHRCAKAQKVTELRSHGRPMVFPAVCWSGPVLGANGWVWASEDYVYSELGGRYGGRLPVLVPVAIGHVTRDSDGKGTRETLWPTEASTLASEDPAWLDQNAIPIQEPGKLN